MKKLVFVFAVVASASLFSCGSSDKEAAANDSVVAEEVVAEEVVDSANTPVDSAAVVAVVDSVK